MDRLALTPYARTAGSSRVRVFSWLERCQVPVRAHSYVQRHNADPHFLVRHPRVVARAELAVRGLAAGRRDWLLLHREASPLSRGALETQLLRSADCGIYDLDDALYTDVGAGSALRRLIPKKPKAEAAARAADRVVVGNEVLADWAVSLCADVRVVPSCVDVSRYRRKHDYRVSGPPRLVWIGSSDNERLLTRIERELTELHRRFGARLTVIGTLRPSLGGMERFVDRIAWSEQVQHLTLAAADVGLMPLEDDPYSRGKCGYKLLQYAAAGLPAVGSPVGANAKVLSTLGYTAATRSPDWLDALVAAIELPDSDRFRIGERAYTQVGAHYSYEAWQTRWEEAVCLGSGASSPVRGAS